MRGMRWIAVGMLLGLAAPVAAGGVLLQPKSAEPWDISEWLNDNPGMITDNRGRVILIHFFQLWCPGCNAFSIPLFQQWEEKYGDRDDVLIVSIHTVFEGHAQQTPDHLRAFIADKGITHPVGIDNYARPDDEVPVTMDRFDTGGTPHVAIVDKQGQLRFSHFGRFDAEPIEAFIDRLLAETGSKKKKKTLRKTPERRKR